MTETEYHNGQPREVETPLAPLTPTHAMMPYGQDTETNPEMNVLLLLAMLRQRWRLILLIWMATLIPLVSFIWIHFEREYQAVGIIRVAPFVPRILFRDEDSGLLPLYGAFLTTQMELLTNPSVLNQAVADPRVRDVPWVAGSVDAATMLDSRLEIANPPNTELITVTLRGRLKEELAPMVNAVLDTYMETIVEKDQQDDRAKLELLYSKQGDLEKDLKTLHDELYALASEHGALSLDNQQNSAFEAFQQVNRQFNEARSDRLAAEARIAALQSEVQTVPLPEQNESSAPGQFQWDPEMKALLNAKVHSEAEFMDLVQRAGPKHPHYQTLKRRIDELKHMIEQRRQTISQSAQIAVLQNSETKLHEELLDAKLRLKEAAQTERTLQAMVEDELAQIAKMGREAVQLESLRENINQTRQLYDAVLQRIQHLEVEKQRPARISITSRATEPKAPAIDKRTKLTKLVFVATLALAIMATIFISRYDTAVHCENDIRQIGLPVLGARSFSEPAPIPEPSDVTRVAEEIRTIRGSVLFAEQSGACRGMLITSPNPQEGKTRLCKDLANALASSGRRVLLVDADNRKRSLTRQFGLENRPGLADLLRNGLDPAAACHHIEPEDLTFLPSGAYHDNFSELLVQPGKLEQLIQLFESYDHFIIDTPPVLLSNEPGIWASHLDGIVMVLRASQSSRQDALDAKDRIAQMGGRIIGAVLNGVDPHHPYYRRRYGYYEHEESAT